MVLRVYYDPEEKQHSMELTNSGSSRSRKFRVQESAGKVLASDFWEYQGVVAIDFLDKGRVGVALIFFLQNNISAYKWHVVKQTIRDVGFKLLDHPSSSPDIGNFLCKDLLKKVPFSVVFGLLKSSS